MKITPIGYIHSPYQTKHEAPQQGWFRPKVISEIEVFKKYEDGLKDIEGFSHLIVLYWMNESKGYALQITTPWDTARHGLFTTRSPNRPNPIGFAVVDLVERKGNLLRVRGLDAIDNTPLVDIKPYSPTIDSQTAVKLGWLENKVGMALAKRSQRKNIAERRD
jgi:tRNA-Thr(GGU) m(6)t(6)A37 methyltransferase TsaA